MLVTEEGVGLTIGCVNWPGMFPYRPEVSLYMSHSVDALHLHYRVKEDGLRASCASDRENVWEDSCVEFFFAPGDDGLYYNIECSCTGRLYMCCGSSREGRLFLPDGAYAAVKRSSSLGESPFGVREGPAEWELHLDIPAGVFAYHDIRDFRGMRCRGNFYKCGTLPHRHYLSWAPINTVKPDFHRPEFFDQIRFDG